MLSPALFLGVDESCATQDCAFTLSRQDREVGRSGEVKMRRLSLLCLCLTTTIAAGCAPRPTIDAAASIPSRSGLLYLYLQPLPREADGLRAEIGSVAALAADGVSHPLNLENSVIDGTAPKRQRLLSAGPLPAGTYRGILVTAASARLVAPRGAGDLRVSDAPRLTEASFTVAEGRATLLTLRLQGEAAIVEGYAFEPTFSAGQSSATGLAPGATAVATVTDAAVLVVFHKLSGEVFDVLRTERGPRGTAYDSGRDRAYVACADADVVEAFDLARSAREQALPLLLGDQPAGLALARDGRTIVVANTGSNTVTVLNAPQLEERFRVPVGREPVTVLLDPDERRALVVQRGSNAVSIVDLASGALVGSFATEEGPVFAAFARDGRRLFVIHRDSPNILLVDFGTLQIERRVYVGVGATAIAVDPVTDRVYLARRGTGQIEVFDPASLLPIETVRIGADVAFLDIDDESEQLLAAIPKARESRAIRLSGGATSAVTDLGGNPAWIDVAGGDR